MSLPILFIPGLYLDDPEAFRAAVKGFFSL